MKGLSMPEDLGMTIVFLLLLAGMTIMVFLVYIQIKFPFFTSENPISYSIDFVSIANKPYTLTEVLSQARFGDRSFLEQAIESTAAGSLDDAQATDLPGQVSDFVKTYGLSYSISIKDGEEIMKAESGEFKCGENGAGWCTYKKSTENCDVGRVEIDSKGACDLSQVCCKNDIQAYAARGRHSVTRCMSIGVCSEGRKITNWYGTFPFLYRTSIGPFCDAGQVYLGTPSACTGDTKVCCAPADEETLTQMGLTNKVTVPLLYKPNIAGKLEVTAK